MGSKPIGRVALMSIHPEHVEAIFEGKKRIEFRKKPIGGDVTHIVVYATHPVSAVVGAFSVQGQETCGIMHLWSHFCPIAGISLDQFTEYYGSSVNGTGIRIGEVYQSGCSLEIEKLFGLSRPPQSFQYIEASSARSFLEKLVEDDLLQERVCIGQHLVANDGPVVIGNTKYE